MGSKGAEGAVAARERPREGRDEDGDEDENENKGRCCVPLAPLDGEEVGG